MPSRNRMGPTGLGPMTGRGLGQCNNNSRLENLNNFQRQGMGFRRGFRGCRRGPFSYGQPPFFAPRYRNSFQSPTAKEEKEIMTENLKALREEMSAVEKRIQELSKQKK